MAILGAGRVGRELGRRLRLLGWRIGSVVTRRVASARAAVRWIGGGEAGSKFSAEMLAADLLLIAVPDRAIAEVAGEIVALSGRDRKRGREHRRGVRAARGIALHTSGSLSHEVLAPLRAAGFAIGAMHPMQTFGRNGRPDFAGSVFGLDGDARAVKLAREIAKALGGTPVEIDARRKAAYHCAGGFAAQHVLAVIEAGIQLLRDVGLTREQAARSLCKMARQTLDNLERHGAEAAWSGPVARGDFATVRKHTEVLRKYPADFLAAYEALTRLVVRLVARQPDRILRELRGVSRGESQKRKTKRRRGVR